MLVKDKIYVICELSQTHEGDLGLARTLVEAAARAGADAVKFQVFTADELAVPAYKHYALFKKLEWTPEQWKSLVDLAHELGMQALADVFGPASTRMLTGIGIDGIKVHATDVRNRPLLREFATLGIPLFLSSGGAYLQELREAVAILRAGGEQRPLVLMHGFQSYPTLIEHTDLAKMKFFGEELGLPYGFADHIDGDHRQNFSLCAMAIGMGACVIEKHITIDRARKMEDYESALDPSGFVEFVAKVRELDAARGRPLDELLPVQADYRKMTRKHVVAVRSIHRGEPVTAQDVALKRAVCGEEPADLERILGKKAARDIGEHEAVLEADVTA